MIAHSRLRPLVWIVFAGFLSGSLGVERSRAEEPAAEFLGKLREKHYFDTALEYLDSMKTSPVAPAKMREVVGYERGLTLVEGAQHQRDLALREKQLDEAQTALDEFVAQQPTHALSFAANRTLGSLILERARLKVERAKRPAEPAKDKLKAEARQLFDKAYTVFQGLGAGIKTRLEAIPNVLDPKRDAKQIELRKDLRADYLQAQLLAAAVMEESADTMDRSSKEYKETLEKAAKEYGAIYEKYRTLIAGLYARMYQGRVHQKLGNLKDALSYYEEILQQSDDEAFHDIKTDSLLLAIDCWMADSQKKYAEVVNRGTTWIEKAYANELRSDEFMALRMAVARAAKLYAEQLRKDKPKDPQINSLLSESRKLAQYVAKFQGEHQKEAQKFLADLGVITTQADTAAQPKTFAEASQAGREALDAFQVHKVNRESLPAQIKTEKDPELKKQLEAKLAEAQEGFKSSIGDALRYYQLAIRLSDSDTSDDDLNSVRYFLCFLYYSEGDYWDAAVMGQFVAQRFPDTGAARQCARISMLAYRQLYGDSKNAARQPIEQLLSELDQDHDGRLSADEVKQATPDKQTLLAGADVDANGKIDTNELLRIYTRCEADHIVEIANFITTKWTDQPEAQEALGTLIMFMISENQLDKAQAYLDKIPVDSSQRGSAELKMGQALWTAYLNGMALVREQEQAAAGTGTAPDAALAARKQDLQAMKNRAEKTLADGVARMEKAGGIDNYFAAAVLSLSQIFVDTEQVGKAVELIERANVGPLALVRNKHEASQQSGYVENTLKIALRAYISSLATADAAQVEAIIKKAEGVMDALKESVGATDAGQKKLVAIYLALARDIEQQMKLASPEAKRNLSKGFETFLTQVGAGAKELNILYWVASTFFSMGESYGVQKDGSVTADAKKYFGLAAKTYQDILDRGAKKQLELEPQLRGQIGLQLAKTKREMGDFDGSIKLFIEMLKEKNTSLTVQMEAARTYEIWAERSGEPKYYLNAMGGSMENKGKLGVIWGWINIAKKTAGNPDFRDPFFDARYHVSLARYKYGLAQKDAGKRLESIEKAEASLSDTYRTYPAIDGDPAENKKSFRDMYEGLAKAIQRSLKKKEVGLAAFELAGPKSPARSQPTGTPVGSEKKPLSTGSTSPPPATPKTTNTAANPPK